MSDGQQPAPVFHDIVQRRIRTIVADDSPEFLWAMGEFLEAQPELELVGRGSNGKEAVALAGALQPQLVVLDLEMPVMNGLRAAELLRAQSSTLRIIVVSINDSATWVEACRVAGVDVFVAKQQLSRELPGQIKRLFTNRAGARIGSDGNDL
ncbi:MAG TPA: response regulator transcription factor [Verrucomicrobiae bacterium]|nr:response regulator transcription factor [Verrucomicrobiae bacterium]